MANYHVGCGAFGIYAGTLKKNNDEWRDKTDVTTEALCAVALHLLENNHQFRFKYKGEWYVMGITKMEVEQCQKS